MRKDKDSEKQISWCLKQKRGIRLEEPNDTLCYVYIKKAKSSLNILESAVHKEEIEWIATTAYYARYFALYALLQKCGIRSEIHDCSISLMHFLFVEENLIEQRFYDELQSAKELRVETQYYMSEDVNLNKVKRDSENARDFVLQIEEVIEYISTDNIEGIREKLLGAI